MCVRLVSSDGRECIRKREHLFTSGAVKATLSHSGQFVKNKTNEVSFTEIASPVLAEVYICLTYKMCYSCTEIPEFPSTLEIALALR